MPELVEEGHLVKVWIPRWYLEDLGIDVARGDRVSWALIPVHREWYKDMLGDDAPVWEIDSVLSNAPGTTLITGVLKAIWAIAPDLEDAKAPSITERWPSEARVQELNGTANVSELNISVHVTGFVVDLQSD